MMSNNFQPRVSIGMPIYNEGKHLEEALTSILSQTYSNIELIIVDNCSDDQSNLICKKFIEADNRIRYIKNKHNIGAGNNFVKALSIASSSDSKYYCYARGDGFYSKNSIKKCVNALEQNEDVVLAYSRPFWVDQDSNIIKKSY